MVLQLKTGSIQTEYFSRKFSVDVWREFETVYSSLAKQGMLSRNNGTIELTRRGLLEVDTFLPEFFEPEARTARYA
jgi:oxygen-independent coproporphyrinogen-3 oxidase